MDVRDILVSSIVLTGCDFFIAETVVQLFVVTRSFKGH